ncbi:MAG: hypothetical protein Q7V01_01350, partial [Vicinamibacterales bacterium]|nr:hypothetical protein [Vicinamibacterales bacterium]
GQTRTVHAIHLVARATPEERVLARLVRRATAAAAVLSDTGATPFAASRWDDSRTADVCLGLLPPRTLWGPAPRPAAPDAAAMARLQRPALHADGHQHARAQVGRRRLDAALRRHRRPSTLVRDRAAPFVLIRAGRSDRRRGSGLFVSGTGTRALAVFEFRIVDGRQRLVDEHQLVLLASVSWVATHAVLAGQASLLRIAAMLERHPLVRDVLDEEAMRRLAVVRGHVASTGGELVARRLIQEAQLRERLRERAPYQAGLFDGRAEREAGLAAAAGPGAGQVPPTWSAARPGDGSGGLSLAHPPRLRWLWWPGCP